MASPYHSKASPTQKREVLLLHCLCYEAFGKGKVFPQNCSKSNLVDIQR